MKGETVTLVYSSDVKETDAFQSTSCMPISQEISNVLVQPLPQSSGGADSTRPDGVTIMYRLFFPKLFVYGIDNTTLFRGASIIVRGAEYKVINVPDYFDAEVCPGNWCMTVDVGAIDG